MDEKTPLYNSRIIRTYLEYLSTYHPEIDRDTLLDYADITKQEVYDPAHFLTQLQINRFHEILAQKTHDSAISREVGRYVTSSEAFGTIRTHLLGLLSPLTTYEIVSKITNNLSRHVTITSKRLGQSRIAVRAIPKKGIQEMPFQCENRMGSLEALAKLHTGHYASIDHTRCMHKGDDLCEYVISFKQTRGIFWKRLRNYVSIIGAFIILPLWFFLPVVSWGLISASIMASVAMLHAYCCYVERKELIKTIEEQSKSAQELIELTNRLYNNAQLIQELGQVSSTILDVQTLCSEVIHVLMKYLDIDRSAVLLADDSKDRLVYSAGYAGKEEHPFKNMVLAVKDLQSNDPIVQTFISRKPLLFDTISPTNKNGNTRYREFHERMGAFSYICIPIVYERESLGVLYIDNPTIKNPITLSDQNLLMGVASQIAIGITNVRSYQKLQESEQHYRTIFESTSNPTIIIEEDTTISLVNSQFEHLSGYSKQEIEDRKSWTEFIHQEDLNHMKTRHGMRRINPGGTPKNYEFRFIDKQGTVKNIFLTVDLIPHTTKSVASLLDITERAQALEDLKKSEERYRLLAENVHDVIWVMDLNFRYTYISPSVENLKGFSVEEAMSMSLEEIYTPESYQSLMDVISQELLLFKAKGIDLYRSVTLELEQICKDGSTVWTEVTASVLLDENNTPKGILGITRDISDRKKAYKERKRLETQLQQAQKMEAIGTLAGGIAHDFNNLLMGIQGNASLMLTDIDPMHSHFDRLKSIEQYVRDGANLTRQLLGFARGGKYEVKPTDTNEIIGKSSDMFARTRKEITIHSKYQDDIWTVEMDRGQIEQVLLNLYVNAWQAMPEGGELYLETQNVNLDSTFVEPYHLPPGRYVKISVTDNGSGMDKTTQKRIFEPFFTTKEKSRGTGLGLASAYGIIMNHEGIINVSSTKGVGTTFNIYLPASQKEIEQKKEPVKDILRGSETILLVDDEEMILEVGKELLETLGYTVLVAKGGTCALDIYTKDPKSIDLVILDMVMPDLSGGETYDALKEMNSHLKVLLSSGYSADSQAKQILERGCDGFIQKPFSLKEISQKLREILDSR